MSTDGRTDGQTIVALLCFFYETKHQLQHGLNAKLRPDLLRIYLRIETGRYGAQRVERHLRYCTVCDMMDIEDEFHFVLKVPTIQ